MKIWFLFFKDNLQYVRGNNDNQPIKDIVMKLIDMQWARYFYVETCHINYEDKKNHKA